MSAFGKIEAILNDQLVLISSSEPLNPGDVVTVFTLIDDLKLKEMGYSDSFLYPHGELKVVCRQTGNRYLAELFRETHTRTRKIVTPSPFLSALSQLQPETKEVTEEVYGEWSAQLNTKQSLGIRVPDAVSVGDLIGRPE